MHTYQYKQEDAAVRYINLKEIGVSLRGYKKKPQNAVVVGCITSTGRKAFGKKPIGEFDAGADGSMKNAPVYKHLGGHTVCYLPASEGKYIAVVDTEPFCIVVFVLAAALLVGAIVGTGYLYKNSLPAGSTSTSASAPKIADGSEYDGEIDTGAPQVSDETIAIPGYSKIFVSEGQKVDLVNPASNTVLFKYIITEGDTTLFETDYILPGEKVEWVATDSIKTAGTHDLVFAIQTIDSVKYTPCNGATMTVTATVS